MQKIGQISVPVKDFNRAISFYQNILELPLLFSTGTLAFFDCNGVRLLLSLPEKEEFAHASSILYFQVEEIHKAHAEFTNKGVSFIDEPHLIAKIGQTETWMSFFKDTEGNTHALMSEVEAE
ncbi:VOC family protein [Planococcus sp. N028]|uniref:VOC family protein n=1 Tax=Planococcus shixiaomingii TaxID=3058393 RepID=A0ABT8N3I7_9BACL|nr:VOC family protein [Planococcus sp. N028]MDN7242458.1 VOC family protein [Planococcus sp. N028]